MPSVSGVQGTYLIIIQTDTKESHFGITLISKVRKQHGNHDTKLSGRFSQQFTDQTDIFFGGWRIYIRRRNSPFTLSSTCSENAIAGRKFVI